MNEIVHPKGKLYYSMGEVCELFGVKPSLIRFWEENFSILKPHRNNKGNRLFTPADVDNIGLIYNLVKERGMTLAGAAKKIKEDRKGKNTLNHNVEIIQRLQKIRNLLREVKEDIDNDDSVVALFEDDDEVDNTPIVEMVSESVAAVVERREGVVEEMSQAENNVQEQGVDGKGAGEAVDGEEKIKKKRGRPKKEPAIENKEKSAKRGRKKKTKYEEQYLDLFSMIEFEQVSVAEDEQQEQQEQADKESLVLDQAEIVHEVAPVVESEIMSDDKIEIVAEEVILLEETPQEGQLQEEKRQEVAQENRMQEKEDNSIEEDEISVVEEPVIGEGEMIIIPERVETEKKTEEVKQIFF